MYVYQLAKEIVRNGHDCLVISVSNELKVNLYEDIQIEYVPFEMDSFDDTHEPKNLKKLIEIVQRFNPDVFHLHTYTPTLGIKHLQAVKKLGVKVFLTAHLPSLTCIRGDLMQYGKVVCDGKMEKNKCMDCYINSMNYNAFTKFTLNSLYSLNILNSKFKTLQAFDIKLKTIELLKTFLDKLILVSEWQRKVLLVNGYSENKLAVSRQAIFSNTYLDKKEFDLDTPLQIGFIGRIVRIKGLHILLNALKGIEKSNYKLSVAAIKANNELAYYEAMKDEADKLNVNWVENLTSNQIIDFLDNVDLLIIPSTMLETGPFTAFEALARKVPILAFNYGGVAELIKNNVNGFLVESESELKLKLNAILKDKNQLLNISRNIIFKRDSNLIYEEMIPLYTY